MKLLVALVLCLSCSARGQAQDKLSPADWQADLEFLRQTVHDEYPFLFKKITAEQFDASVDQLHQQIPELQEHEIVTGLARIVSSFGYGHTVLGVRESAFKFHQLPVNLYQFSDGIFVEGAHRDYQQILGARLIEVQGVPIDDVLTAIRPVVPAENDQFFKAHGLTFLGIPEVLHAQGVSSELNNEITLTLERDGKRFTENIVALDSVNIPRKYGFVQPDDDWLSARDDGPLPLYLKHLDKLYFLEYLPGQKTLYVRHSQILDETGESIPQFYDRVFEFVENNDVERLVIDVRLNGGGNNYKIKPIVTGLIRSTKINQPGKLFVIIGRRTFSACQNLVNELDNYTNAIFVGEPTAENVNFYGDNRRVELPNSKIPVHLSFAWWQDKPQWENGSWTAPQVAVELSFDDYRSNRDPVLETVLDFSDSKFVIDPIAHLTRLFEAGQFDELAAEATQLVNDPRYRFFDFEGQANQAGYNLLGDNEVEGAIFVFQLNTRLFPNSANAWDSLAEAHLRAKQTEKAIEYYERAIELDPDGPIGANSRGMLEQIR